VVPISTTSTGSLSPCNHKAAKVGQAAISIIRRALACMAH